MLVVLPVLRADYQLDVESHCVTRCHHMEISGAGLSIPKEVGLFMSTSKSFKSDINSDKRDVTDKQK